MYFCSCWDGYSEGHASETVKDTFCLGLSWTSSLQRPYLLEQCRRNLGAQSYIGKEGSLGMIVLPFVTIKICTQ